MEVSKMGNEYEDVFVVEQKRKGWKRTPIMLLSKRDVDNVTIQSVSAGSSGVAIRIKARSGEEISMSGKKVVPEPGMAHKWFFKLADATGEIADESSLDSIYVNADKSTVRGNVAGNYAMFNKTDEQQMYRTVEIVHIKENCELQITAYPEVNGIDPAKSLVQIECDLWTKA
jgi:hypothetical protein